MNLGFEIRNIYQTFKVSGLFVGMMILPVPSSCLVDRNVALFLNCSESRVVVSVKL